VQPTEDIIADTPVAGHGERHDGGQATAVAGEDYVRVER
jgi:hypothetical protein